MDTAHGSLTCFPANGWDLETASGFYRGFFHTHRQDQWPDSSGRPGLTVRTLLENVRGSRSYLGRRAIQLRRRAIFFSRQVPKFLPGADFHHAVVVGQVFEKCLFDGSNAIHREKVGAYQTGQHAFFWIVGEAAAITEMHRLGLVRRRALGLPTAGTCISPAPPLACRRTLGLAGRALLRRTTTSSLRISSSAMRGESRWATSTAPSCLGKRGTKVGDRNPSSFLARARRTARKTTRRPSLLKPTPGAVEQWATAT